jgi:(E)-4-hydroxy-3-methylbut-2-enyl-diphosphate synthase
VVLTIIDDIQHSYIYSAATGAQRSPLIYNPYQYARRETAEIDVNGCSVGGNSPIRVFTNRIKWNKLSRIMDQLGPITPEGILEDSRVIAVDPYDTDTILMINAMENPQLVTVVDGAHGAAVIHAFRLLANKLSTRHSILLKDTLRPLNKRPRSPLTAQIKASRNLGSLLCDGIGDVILIQGESNPEKSIHLAFNILQATGLRGTPVNSPDSCQ